jgi:hypothetical protein
MKFHTIAVGGSPSERMRINSSGRVGIGTSSPNALLEVSSATGISPITPSVIRISTTNNAAGWDLGSPWGALQFYSADTSDGGAKVHAQISANCKSSTGGISDIVFSQAAPATGVLTERMKIDATAGNVGIGTSSVVSKLTVLSENAPTLDNTTHAGEALFLRSGGSAGQNNIQSVLAFGKADGGSLRSGSAIGSVQTGADEDQIGLAFYTSPSSTSAQTLSEKLRINHDGGITFNGDTAAANALDDYEEGTFTPSLNGYSGQTYSSQIGHYTKIGRFVQVSFRLVISNVGTFVANSFIGGFPFAAGITTTNATGGQLNLMTGYTSARADQYAAFYNGTANLFIYTASGTAQNGNNFQAGEISGTLTYFA